jgi:hypothetical protein
LLTTSE